MPHRRTCVTRCAADNGTSRPALAFFATGGQGPALKPSELLAAAPAASEPIPVYTGPTRTGPALIAAVAADAAEEAGAAKDRGKKTHVAAKRPPEAGADDASKPAKHANAAAKTADKPATDAKPAKPKTVAKPAKPKPDAKSS